MKYLEDYVCTLEQVKKLKELGVKQDSLFYYAMSDKAFLIVQDHLEAIKLYNLVTYSAFTSQELGEFINNHLSNIGIYQSVLGLIEFYQNNANKVGLFFVPKEAMEKEAQARAEFLIYLLEDNK